MGTRFKTGGFPTEQRTGSQMEKPDKICGRVASIREGKGDKVRRLVSRGLWWCRYEQVLHQFRGCRCANVIRGPNACDTARMNPAVLELNKNTKNTRNHRADLVGRYGASWNEIEIGSKHRQGRTTDKLRGGRRAERGWGKAPSEQPRHGKRGQVREHVKRP